mgnify:CR=1 FL=1
MREPRLVRIAENASSLARIAADCFLTTATETVRHKGAFFVALSGGSTPRDMYRLLPQRPYRTAVPWDHLHLFWVDERCVPHADRASNFGTTRRDFLKAVDIPPEQVHPMPTNPGSDEAALAYEKVLKETVPLNRNGMPSLDMAFLGVGRDGHTASLFPCHAALREYTRWVVPLRGGTPCVDRFTLTLPVLNSAEHVVFLVSGIHKASVIKRIFKKSRTPSLPAQHVEPVNGRVIWLLDEEAASRL